MSLQQPNKAERARLVKEAERMVEIMKSYPILTPCSECVAFRDGWCQHWKASVPPEHQARGCGEWSEQIPF